MKNYEIMFIVRPDVDETTVKSTAQSLEKVLTDHKAKITLSKELGQKEFAYEIKKFKSGHYFVFNFDTENENAVSEFNRLATIDSDIVRHLITKVGE